MTFYIIIKYIGNTVEEIPFETEKLRDICFKEIIKSLKEGNIYLQNTNYGNSTINISVLINANTVTSIKRCEF